MLAPQQQIEPRLLTVFRAFSWTLWALLTLGACASLGRHGGVPDFGSLLGWPVVSLLLLYLYAGFLRRALGRAYLPLALAWASAGPCVVVALAAALDVRAGLRGAAAGGADATLYVVLLLPLLLISVQYSFRELMAFTVGTSLLTVLLAVPVAQAGGPSLVTVTQGAVARLVFFSIAGALVVPVSRAQRKLREEQVIKNAQLSDYALALEQLAVTRERNRIAREMHDTLAHTLSAVSVQLEALDVLWDSDPMAARSALGRVRDMTRGGLDEARRALHALRAAPVDELGLVLALRRLGEAAAERGGMRLECDLPPQVTGLRPQTEQQVYRVAEEALNNAARHSGGHALRLWLRPDTTGDWRLTISDDGAGFDPSAAPTRRGGHYGVTGMRERAAMIGALLEVHSRPGGGTAVVLRMPGAEGGASA